MNSSLSWWHVIIFFIVVFGGMELAKKSYSKKMAGIICFVLICVAGLRHGYVDTRSYRAGFEALIPSEILNWENIVHSDSYSVGFSVLSAFVKSFTTNSQAFLWILSFITVGLLFWGFVKNVYWKDIDLAIFLFITTGCYLETMNGVRQYLAIAIMFYFLPNYIKEKKLVNYLVVVLLVATIHPTALLFIPIYFVAMRKPWGKATAGIVIVCILLYVFFNSGVGSFIADILEETTYGSGEYTDMLLNSTTSVNFLRVLVAAVPVGLSLFVHKVDEDDEDTYETDISNYYCAMSYNMPIYKEMLQEAELSRSAGYFNAGIMLLNLKAWREDKIQQRILQYYYDHGGNFPTDDQSVINAIVAESTLVLP